MTPQIWTAEVHADQMLASRKCKHLQMTSVPLPQVFLLQMWYFHPWSNDLEFYSKCGLLNVLIVYSHKVALQIKGKTSVRWDRRKVGDWEELHSHPNIVYRSRRYKKAFFCPLTVLQFWWHEHDTFCPVIVKSFKWFSIHKCVRAGQSCYLALLQPSGCDGVFRAVRKVMVSPHRCFCFSSGVQILKKTHFFPSFPALPQPRCLCFCSDWDLDKLWALWKDGRQ